MSAPASPQEPRPRVWIVDDDASIRWVLERALHAAGYVTRTFEGAEPALRALAETKPDALVTDIRMPDRDGLELLRTARGCYPELPVLVMTAYADLDNAVSAYGGGAFEYLPKPFEIDEVVATLRRALSPQPSSQPSPGTGDAAVGRETDLIGEAPAMQAVFRAIGRLVASSINVLITGETGSGKELVARALHRHSPRADAPFVAINTAAIPAELLESELFGHERGAFTGAHTARSGRFEQAAGGTLFLDEIGDMPATLQTRLLRVLSEGEHYRVGGRDPRHSDVRVIAATHQDLAAAVAEGRFRQDLYHRLNVMHLHVPALRERREDIPALTRHFLWRAAEALSVDVKQAAPELLDALAAYEWPGNVRELDNACRRMTALASGPVLYRQDLPEEIAAGAGGAGVDTGVDAAEEPTADAAWERALRRWAEQRWLAGETGVAKRAEERLRQVLVDAALTHTGGRRAEAASLLGWGRNTVTRRLRDEDD